MKRLLAAHPFRSFILLAFGFAWIAWIPAAVLGSSNPRWQLEDPVSALALFACGPSLAGLLLAWAQEGRAGAMALLRRCIQWRFAARWYLFILLSPAALLLAGGYLRHLTGGEPVSFSNALIHQVAPGLNPWAILPVILVTGLLAGPLNEELGWRGFALPYLQRRFSPVWATLILGCFWGAWHVPLFFLPNTSQIGQPLLPFMAGLLANSFYYTWVHNRTGGSVLAAIVLHAAFNTSAAYVPALPSEWWAIAAMAAGAAVVVLTDRRGWLTPPTDLKRAA